MPSPNSKLTYLKLIASQYALAPTLLVVAITSAYVLLILGLFEWDPMIFVRLGTRFGEGDPNGTLGYDGQYAYQLARQPFDATPHLDTPAYRYQRILYPLTARLVAFGQTALIPWALLGLNLLALTVSCYGLARLLINQKLNPWFALPAALFVGQLVSLRLDLNEPFALGFSILAALAYSHRRGRLCGVLLALALLSKETSIVFVGGFLAYFVFTQKWRTLFEVGIISLGPFALWQIFLWLKFGQIALRPGAGGSNSFSFIPFGALLRFDLADPDTLIVILMIVGPLIIIPCLLLTVSVLNRLRQLKTTPATFYLGGHILLMAILPFSTYADMPGMLRVTSGLVIATLLYGAEIRSLRILRYAMLWLATIPILIFIG